LKKIFWYTLVVLSLFFLILSVVVNNIGFALLSAGITWYLRNTNHEIDIPTVYKQLGIKNELFNTKKKKSEEIL